MNLCKLSEAQALCVINSCSHNERGRYGKQCSPFNERRQWPRFKSMRIIYADTDRVRVTNRKLKKFARSAEMQSLQMKIISL